MNDRDVKRLDSLVRVDGFGKKYAADFPATGKAAQLFGGLDGVIVRVKKAGALQQGGRATAREVLLDGLRIDMKNIARTAVQIAADVPGFADRLGMPNNPSQTALLISARQMLIELNKEGVAARFVAYELPATFVSDLAEDVKMIDESKDDQNDADTEGVASTATLGAEIRSGLKIVAELNAIMHNKYTRQPEKLVAWKSASHTERVARRGKAGPAGTNGSAPTAPVTATA